MRKKGALNLSIQAIVIIVLAMTLLGLGLGFVRGLFGNISDLSESTFQRISEQLSTDLATSDAPLIFSQSRITLERRDSTLEGFGVRNDGNSPMKYGLKIKTFSCPDDARTTAGDDSTPCKDVTKWFSYFQGNEEYEIKAAERQVNKVEINIPSSSTTGLYLLKLSVYVGEWDDANNKCEDDPATTDVVECEVFGQTELFLTVA